MKPRKRIDVVSLKLVKESSLLYEPRQCTSVASAYQLVRPFIEEKDREHLVVVGLNTKHEPLIINLVHIGTVNQSIAEPRDIFKPVLLSNSTRYIVAHNHPSGDTTPSTQDKLLTKKLKAAGELLGIELLDHLIIGGNCYYSFKEEGQL
ncbi:MULTISPECIES: JAB domain-containing protein [Vagococcus]|uniref:JAB domain-containing protein n=1 Tax=Vagococcus TaxID=2737 RepID=UPI001F505B6F|nr:MULTISPECIES: JAB domain-containing protein [Vagococcus]MCI0131070.1 JAB domain-containing protein [Vagococcus sp. CY53-2]UNM89706.1 JAB domain-containing protein [Vagococcus sp. CY52-2]